MKFFEDFLLVEYRETRAKMSGPIPDTGEMTTRYLACALIFAKKPTGWDLILKKKERNYRST